MPHHTVTPRLALKITRAVALVRRLGTAVGFPGVSIALTMLIV